MADDLRVDAAYPEQMFSAIPATTSWGETWRLLVAGLLGGLLFSLIVATDEPSFLPWGLDLTLGLIAIALLLWRRRYPLIVPLVIVALASVAATASGAVGLALVSLGSRRKWREVLLMLPAWMLSGLVFNLVLPSSGQDLIPNLVTNALTFAACIGIGAAIGSQRSTTVAWRDRAVLAEQESASRVARAQADERARIAREMHDVLAHRISLIAMHAGALAYRPDLPREQVQATAELLRDNADRAVGELRDVLGVLRAQGEVEQPRAPQPDLTVLPALVAEVSALEIEVDLRMHLSSDHDIRDVPMVTSRTAYRVVQEALTNARKHAPGMPVTVTLSGWPQHGLDFEIRNQPNAYGTAKVAPESSGMGLIGLTERVNLVGGNMAFGADRRGDFVVHGQLPWAS